MSNTELEAQWLVIPPSHISDYIKECKRFTDDDYLFETFKQSAAYQTILEHISYEEGLSFVSEMKNLESVSKETINKFKENDIYGGPQKSYYETFGFISPSTIRYIKNTLDIISYFDCGKIKSVVEIGGGYGGLCKTLSVLVDFDNYVLIDLPEVNGLSKKYLGNFSDLSVRASQLSFQELEEIKGELDLTISNYAFSELAVEQQIKYYNSVVNKSKMFYMVYNNFTVGNMNGQEFQELASTDFDIEMELECRPTHINNIFYGSRKVTAQAGGVSRVA